MTLDRISLQVPLNVLFTHFQMKVRSCLSSCMDGGLRRQRPLQCEVEYQQNGSIVHFELVLVRRAQPLLTMNDSRRKDVRYLGLEMDGMKRMGCSLLLGKNVGREAVVKSIKATAPLCSAGWQSWSFCSVSGLHHFTNSSHDCQQFIFHNSHDWRFMSLHTW